MKPLTCGHVAVAGASRTCRHLFESPSAESVSFFRLLLGDGMRWELRCPICVDDAAEVFEVCEGCVSRAEEDGEFLGWRGEPGIGERPEPVDPTIATSVLPDELGSVMDIAPVATQPGVWLVLDREGAIVRWDTQSGLTSPQAVSEVPDESAREPWMNHRAGTRLHSSADGRFAAVVNDFGRHGSVIDLTTAKTTMVLDGGGYHEETVPFSVAFAEHRGRTVVIHRTAWNRLDVSDPATGELLTARVTSTSERDGLPPEHHLDYFHGAISVSPNQRRIADDGWVWSPVGVPVVWSLERWLGADVWESEDGPSRCRLTQRWYRWNNPWCWLDDDYIVIGGIGDDDEAMLDGVEIYQAETGTRTGMFAGPQGQLFADARRLYSASPGGLEVWDPDTGQRTATIAGFVPTHHHVGSGELAVLDDRTLRRWRTSSRGAA
ncbi:hypothetical protein [Catenulispora rubra]|uniref:hypothetical protein n=1 Tax=Catenulispora rubra TaxID=280293 RepID=UPI00189207B6|nr:hypothetical protein [Catenulispora rubra]